MRKNYSLTPSDIHHMTRGTETPLPVFVAMTDAQRSRYAVLKDRLKMVASPDDRLRAICKMYADGREHEQALDWLEHEIQGIVESNAAVESEIDVTPMGGW